MEGFRIEHIFSNRQIKSAIYVIEKENKTRKKDTINPLELREFWEKNGEEVLEKIYTDEYRPAPMIQVTIKKANKIRYLSLPTTLDKMLQKVTAHAVYNLYESKYSECSFGFRKKRSTMDAIAKSLEYINTGNNIILKLDIKNYFDVIEHDILRDILLEGIEDGRIVAWLMRIAKTPIYIKGKLMPRNMGISQGSPLSPCLANIYLNEFDMWLEEKQVKYVRYADDVVLFFGGVAEAERKYKEIIWFIGKKLHLQINKDKTFISEAEKLNFLGFAVKKNTTGYVCVPNKENVRKYIEKIYDLAERQQNTKNEKWEIMTTCNMGWTNYYKKVKREDMLPILREIDTYEMLLLSARSYLEDTEQYKVILTEAWYEFFAETSVFV